MSENEIVLDERFLNTCMNCGGYMKSGSPYDFYCSKKCREKDDKRIQKAIDAGKHPVEILTDSLKRGALKR